MSRATYGIIEIELGKDKYTLTPSLKVMDTIHNKWGDGIRGAVMKAQTFNPRDLAEILAVAADLKDPDIDKLAEAIFDTGGMNVGPSIAAFLYCLLNPRASEKVEAPEDTGE